MVTKQTEKVNKYQPLISDLRQLHPHMSIEVITIVIGHTGVVSLHSKQLFNKIPGFRDGLFYHLQKATLIGTIHILRTLHL